MKLKVTRLSVVMSCLLATPFSALVLADEQEQTDATGVCSICFDGSPVGTPEALVTAFELGFDLDGLTCEELDQEARKLDGNRCNFYRALAPFCGCPEESYPEKRCTPCSDGSSIAPEMWALPTFDNETTCADTLRTINLYEAGENGCFVHQYWGSAYCGCERQCPFCSDGILLTDEQRDVEVIENGDTCGFLEQLALVLGEETPANPTCADFRGISIACGCPEPENACSLCEDDDMTSGFLPDKQIGPRQATCSFLADVSIKAFDDTDEICRNTQATFGTYCGCANPVANEGYCRICGDQLLPDPNAVAYFEPSDDDSGNETAVLCVSVERNEDGLACEELQATYAEACCETATSNSDTSIEPPAKDSSSNSTTDNADEADKPDDANDPAPVPTSAVSYQFHVSFLFVTLAALIVGMN